MKHSSIIIYKSVYLANPMCDLKINCSLQVHVLEYLVPVSATWDWDAIFRRWTLAGTLTLALKRKTFETLQAGLVCGEMLSMCFSTQASLSAAMPSCHEEVTGNRGKAYTHLRTYSFPNWVSVLNIAADIIRQIHIIKLNLQIFLCTYLAITAVLNYNRKKIKNIKQR